MAAGDASNAFHQKEWQAGVRAETRTTPFNDQVILQRCLNHEFGEHFDTFENHVKGVSELKGEDGVLWSSLCSQQPISRCLVRFDRVEQLVLGIQKPTSFV
jgi:hypothetical protein